MFLLLGCESQYDKGYKSGYSDGEDYGYREGYVLGKKDGYIDGEKKGYIQGENDGYKNGKNDGYLDGTKHFLRGNYIPSLGLVILIIISTISIYFVFRYLRNPINRWVNKKILILEGKRKIFIIKKEIYNKKIEENKISKIKARILTINLFKELEELINEAKNERYILKMKNKIEVELERESIILNELKYKEKINKINSLPNDLQKEKLGLIDKTNEL